MAYKVISRPEGATPHFRVVSRPNEQAGRLAAAKAVFAAPVEGATAAGRQLALGTRAVGEGLALAASPFYDAAGAVQNTITLGVNAATGADIPYVRPLGQNVGDVLDASGLPKPSTGGERIMSGTVRAMTSALPFLGSGVLASGAPVGSLTQGVGKALASTPGSQIGGAAAGGALSSATAEATDNPWLIGAADVVGNLGVPMLAAATRATFRGGESGRKAVERAAADFATFDATPTVAQARGGWIAGAVESLLGRVPGGAGRMKAAMDKSVEAASAKIAKIVGDVTPDDAGRALKIGGRTAGERYAETAARTYDEAYAQIEQTARRGVYAADLDKTAGLLAQLRGRLASAPATARESVGPAMARIEALLSDIATNKERGGLSFAALRQARTALGEDLKTAGLMGVSGSAQTPLSALYGALTEDMNRYATKWGGGDAIRLADRYYRAAKFRTDDLLAGVIGREDTAKVFEAATRADATTLRALRSAVTEDRWVPTAKATLDRLGRATPGQQNAAGDAWSFETFLTNYSKMPPPVKKTLFGRLKGVGNLDADIEAIARAAGDVRAAQRVLANPSGTAATAANISAGTLFAYSLAYNQPAAAAMAAGAGAANIGARLMTSPRFIKFLSAATRMPVERIPSLLVRLADLAKAEPENADAIAQFIEQFRSGQSPQSSSQ